MAGDAAPGEWREQKVNLFIVGAAKAGTSSLWKALGQHPDIFTVTDERFKEPAYFSEKGERLGLKKYHSLFDDGSRSRYRCDASTAYLTSPESAQRIHDYNSSAKIVIVLRNPVDRAYSLYNWMVANGYEWAPDFETALALEEQRSGNKRPSFRMPEYYWNYMYFRSGCYSRQIERYIARFGSNVLLLTFKDLVSRPSRILNEVLSFLAIEKKDIDLPHENPAKAVYDPRLTFAARKLTNFAMTFGLGRLVRKKRHRDLLVRLTLSNRPLKKLREETRKDLARRYAKEMELLDRNYGIQLS
jgi:hypothetical protein